MRNLDKRQIIVLLIVTFLVLFGWVQFVIREINTYAISWNDGKLRLELSDVVGFMRSNWESINEPYYQNELSKKLKAADVEAILFDDKTQTVIFSYGNYADKAVATGSIEELFGLSQQEDMPDIGYRQLTWMVYRQNYMLGAIKFYIHNKNLELPVYALKTRVVISGIGISILLLLFWTGFLQRNIKVRQKAISCLNIAIKNLAQWKWNAPIQNIETDEELKESFRLLDRMQRDIKEMFLAKEKYEESRKILINYLMHDIRTPIASMKALTEGLIDGVPKTEESKIKYYQGIQKKIAELEKLTDDLFHHMNIEVGALEVNPEEGYCDEIMIPILSGIQAKSLDGNLEINYQIPHILVKLDSQRIEQVLGNLVTNAVKYSQENCIIRINIYKEENMVVLQVVDNGIGISKEDLPFIFDHFFRGEKSRSRQFGGSGLGLSIVKYIVEAHCGYITVKSQPGKGSVFSIYFPLV